MANLQDVLTGAYLEIGIVTNLGTTEETETILGWSTGETTVSRDSTDAEFSFHESKLTQIREKHVNLTLEFATAVAASMPQLETLGLVDTDGTPTGATTHEAIRVYVYDEAPEENSARTPGLVFEFQRVETSFDELTLPQDGSEVSYSANVNGGWQIGATTA